MLRCHSNAAMKNAPTVDLKLFSTIMSFHTEMCSYSHSHSSSELPRRVQVKPSQELWAWCVVRCHFNKRTGRAGTQTTKPVISGRPSLPAQPPPPISVTSQKTPVRQSDFNHFPICKTYMARMETWKRSTHTNDTGPLLLLSSPSVHASIALFVLMSSSELCILVFLFYINCL